MKKVFKSSLFALSILTTTTQIIHGAPDNEPSPWQIFINIVWGAPAPVEAPHDTTSADTNVEAYITQLRYDLNGNPDPNKARLIPQQDMDEIEYFIRKNIFSYDLQNTDRAEQKLHNILVNHVTKSTERVLDSLEREGIYVTRTGRGKIIQSQRENMTARLQQIPHLNGESIAQFFGAAHQETITKLAQHPQYAARNTWGRFR